MENEYILSFSSFYKAAYARDVLGEAGINSTLRKLPPELVRSCSTGLYLRLNSIQPVISVFSESQIVTRGMFKIERDEKGKKYLRV